MGLSSGPIDVKPYLSIFGLYRDEAHYLREWIEFHRLVGVERFFLYDNLSEDDHLDVLRPYIEDGTVVYRHWPLYPAQMQAYAHFLEHHRHDSTWVAFIDVDEFLFSPTGRKISDLLREYQQWPGVGVNCLAFGTSGHLTRQPGLAIENYVRRCAIDKPRNRVIKSVAQPERVELTGRSPHYFRYLGGERAVDENKQPIRGDQTESVSCEILRINHYITRSQAERDAKLAGPDVLRGKPRDIPRAKQRDLMLNDELDETILRYAPELRAALAR
jgi:hypothetical protein